MASDRKPLDGLKVVVADDEPFSLAIVVRMIGELGCKDIVEAVSGPQALVALDGTGKLPDLTLLDFNMPGFNGMQILKKLRTGALPVPRETRVVMLTGTSDFALVGTAMALDIDAFILKPVSLLEMSLRLKKALCQASALKDAAHYARIDIEAVTRRLLSRKPVGLAKPKAPAVKKREPVGLPVRLDTVQPGAFLSEEIRSQTGELLLGKATQLTERMIQRLQEVQPVLKLEYLYVFPSSVTDQA